MTPPRSLIAFDMDGVLIDVSQSYREVIRQASRLFFTGAHGWQDLPDPLFSLDNLAELKQTGGLNNDWDVTYEVIRRLCRQVTTGRQPSQAPNDDAPVAWAWYQQTIAAWDVTPLARFLASTSHPLARLADEIGLSGSTADAVPGFYKKDVSDGNIIKRLFQEVYLGFDLFSSTYQMTPAAHKGAGLYRREKPLVPPAAIADLARNHILALATGRPALEANTALNAFGLKNHFTTILTLDTCLAAEQALLKNDGTRRSLSKPNPFMLDAITDQLVELPETRYYVGDMPDDMLAASRSKAGFIGIGFTASVQDKIGLEKKLIATGAGRVFNSAAALVQFLSATA
jgi:phosphoglycolate phosphatase-like HAD superfamily hydrolase